MIGQRASLPLLCRPPRGTETLVLDVLGLCECFHGESLLAYGVRPTIQLMIRRVDVRLGPVSKC